MYQSFFGLKDQPFRLTPDPTYLFMSAKHREAFAHLLYGVNEGSGFVAVTGEVGAGKTTLVRALLREADDNVTVIYIVNPVLTSTELLQTINAELQLPSSSTSRKELIESLSAFLHRNQEAGGRAVVIVDEAQNLEPVVLEQLRLLSNLETETEKLIQIVLVGQPELRTLLDRHDLRQLNQRVTVRWHLDRLDRSETVEYIRHRLGVAGATSELFDSRAVDLIYRYSEGVPRLINILSHRSLLVAFTRSVGKVGGSEVTAAAKELGHGSGPVRMKRGRGLYQAAAIASVTALAAGAAFYLSSPTGLSPFDERPVSSSPRPLFPDHASEPAPEPAAVAPVAVEAAAPAPSEPAPVQPAAVVAAPPTTLPVVEPPVEAPIEEIAELENPADPGAAAAVEVADLGDPPAIGDIGYADPATEPQDPVAQAPAEVAPAVAEVVPPVPDVTPVDPDVLLAELAVPTPFEAAAESLSGLLELWGTAPLAPLELRADALDLAAIADSRGLRYMAAQMNTAFLTALDLPAVLEIELPDREQSGYVRVESWQPSADLAVLARGRRVSASKLKEWWNGRAHVLWRDSRSLGDNLGPGSGGPRVRTLQVVLAEIGFLDAEATGLFGALTENAVRRFQETHHVVADGIVGPVTQILLYNSLPGEVRPRLLEVVGGDEPTGNR
jgi:general secretion pathway protein A